MDFSPNLSNDVKFYLPFLSVRLEVCLHVFCGLNSQSSTKEVRVVLGLDGALLMGSLPLRSHTLPPVSGRCGL